MQAHRHSIKRILIAIFGILSLGWAQASQAENKVDNPSCLSAFGDIWGQEKQRDGLVEIDGSKVSSLADLSRKLSRRDGAIRIINGGDFSRWDFSAAGLEKALSATCFYGSKLTEGNFSGATAAGIGFIKSDLTGADLSGTNMPGIMFRDANLTDMIATNANFSGGHFDGGWFEGGVAGWNLDGANMSGFAFECGITVPDGCPVYQGGDPMSMRKTNFTGAILESFSFFDAAVEDALLDGTIIGPDQIPNFAKANISADIILRGGDQDVLIAPSEFQILVKESQGTQIVADSPSFACNRARSKIEKEICGEYQGELRKQDRDIAMLYKRAGKKDRSVRKSQRLWLKKRNLCVKQEFISDCLRQSYSDRKGELLGMLGEGSWLEPGAEAVFVDDVLTLPASMRGTDIYKKITPVLAGASMASVYIKRNADGTIEATGESVGANAHTCTLGAAGVRFHAETGWYSVTQEKDGKTVSLPVFRYFDDRIEIYRNGKPEYGNETDALIDYVSCGARASFGEMIRMEIPESRMTPYRRGPETY